VTWLAALPVELIQGDVLDRGSVSAAATKCDVLFHCAARFTYSSPLADLEELASRGTLNVLRAARRWNVRRVIVTSSSVIFGYDRKPRSRDESAGLATEDEKERYVTSKIRQARLARRAARQLSVVCISVCPTLSVGPTSTALGPSNQLIVAYLADPFRISFPGGCNIVSAADVGRAHVIAARLGRPGTAYIAGSQNLEWTCVHQLIGELSGTGAPRVVATRTACILAATAEEARARVLGQPPHLTLEQARMVGRYYWYTHSRLVRLGYRPRPARRALAEAIAWLAASPHVPREVRAQMQLSSEVYRARRVTRPSPVTA
jgi:dihydroflavonol-4-reductase